VTVIDLDAPIESPTEFTRRGRRPNRRLVLTGALAVAVLAAAGGPDELPYRPRFAPPVTIATQIPAFAVAADALYAGSEPLAAYRITDGRRMWTVDVPMSPYRWAVRAGDTVLTSDATATLGLDPRTGTRRWTAPGIPVWAGGEVGRAATIMEDHEPDGTVTKPGVIAVVDLTTGAIIWRKELLHASDRLVFGEHGGILSAVGLLLDGRYLPFDTLMPQDLPPLPEQPVMSIVDDLMLVTDAGRGAGTSAYDRTTLRLLWSNPDAAAYATSCGRYLCTSTGRATVALDRATGQSRWQVAGMVLSSGRDVERLTVLFGPTASDGPADSVAVVDAVNGRTLQRFPGWLPIGATPDGLPPGDGKLPDRSVAFPVERVDPDSGRIDVGVLDLRRLQVYRIASLDTALRNCRATATHVACRAGPGEIRVWRYAR
jgi:outer membrane protein assembly factor BamB